MLYSSAQRPHHGALQLCSLQPNNKNEYSTLSATKMRYYDTINNIQYFVSCLLLLTLNRNKTVEVIFVDKKRKLTATLPPHISGISRSTSLKILGVTITSSLSVADHIHTIVTSCS